MIFFDKDLFFSLKIKNFQEFQLKYGLLFFAHLLYVALPKNMCVDFFCFAFVLFS